MITLQKKQALIDSAKHHQVFDEYQTGIFFKNGKGCAVGCAIADINRLENLNINHNDHEALAEYLDIPVFLTRMQDNIFERCTDDYRKNWPVKFLEAIPTDRTISDLIVPKFLLFVFKDSDCPDINDVLTNWIETGEPDKEAARAANGVEALNVADNAIESAETYDLYGEELLRLMNEIV